MHDRAPHEPRLFANGQSRITAWGLCKSVGCRRLRCGARQWDGVAELTALTLGSDSRDEFDVDVRWRALAPLSVRLATPRMSHPHGPPATPLTPLDWGAPTGNSSTQNVVAGRQ